MGLAGIPLSIKASYYFDIFQEPQNYVIVQTKSENIDTYAVRLKEIMDTIQFKTRKPKVIIIAHSMGGLVARRYLQIFGSDKVDKLIMIGTPNKGISGDISEYCPIIGEKSECKDMNENSLFINKLNRGKLPDIEVDNIVGSGCNMKNGIGDGIVLEQNAKLDDVNNFVVNGACSGTDMVHTQLLDIDMYPEVYEIIKKALSIS